MLASQPEVIWLWYQVAALASPEPLEHCLNLSSVVCMFPQIATAAEEHLVNGGCPSPLLVHTLMYTFSVFEEGLGALNLPFSQHLVWGPWQPCAWGSECTLVLWRN